MNQENKVKKQWLVAIAATILLVSTIMRTDINTWKELSPADLLPVIGITVVIFVFKTGVFSGVLILGQKLIHKLRAKKS